jgi:hypothetical protein
VRRFVNRNEVSALRQNLKRALSPLTALQLARLAEHDNVAAPNLFQTHHLLLVPAVADLEI